MEPYPEYFMKIFRIGYINFACNDGVIISQ